MSLSKFFLTFCRSSSAVVAAMRAFDTAERVSRLLYIGMESDRPIDSLSLFFIWEPVFPLLVERWPVLTPADRERLG